MKCETHECGVRKMIVSKKVWDKNKKTSLYGYVTIRKTIYSCMRKGVFPESLHSLGRGLPDLRSDINDDRANPRGGQNDVHNDILKPSLSNDVLSGLCTSKDGKSNKGRGLVIINDRPAGENRGLPGNSEIR